MRLWRGIKDYTFFISINSYFVYKRSLSRTTPNQQHPVNPNISSNLPPSVPGTPSQSSPAKQIIANNLAKLMTSCIILRIEDFTLYRVTTSGKKQMPKEFIAGNMSYRFNLFICSFR